MDKWMLKILGRAIMIGVMVSLFSSPNVFAQNPAPGQTVQRTIMKVDKLTCGSCLATINQKLNTIEGVVGMGANLSRGLVAVDHTKVLESKKIAEAISSIGYPATVLSVTEIDSSKSFASARSRR